MGLPDYIYPLAFELMPDRLLSNGDTLKPSYNDIIEAVSPDCPHCGSLSSMRIQKKRGQPWMCCIKCNGTVRQGRIRRFKGDKKLSDGVASEFREGPAFISYLNGIIPFLWNRRSLKIYGVNDAFI